MKTGIYVGWYVQEISWGQTNRPIL